MLYRLQKFAVGATHLLFLWLLVRTFLGYSAWNLSAGCLALSALWLVLTALQTPQLLSCFADRMARLQLLVPLWTGVVLAIIGGAAWSCPASLLGASSLLAAWGVIYYMFHRTSKGYYRLGHGYMWNDAAISPTIDQMDEGDIILTDGNMARRSRNTVGHAELVVKDPEGKLWVVSSYQGKGAVKHTLRALLKGESKDGRHWIVLKPKTKWTKEQSAKAWQVALEMIAANKAWKKETTESRTVRINNLWLPTTWKAWLLKRFTPHDGYDWLGLYLGTIKPHRWTCMGFILLLLERIGVKMEKFGTGPLGLTGLLNPLMPIRLATRARQYTLLRKPAPATVAPTEAVA